MDERVKLWANEWKLVSGVTVIKQDRGHVIVDLGAQRPVVSLGPAFKSGKWELAYWDGLRGEGHSTKSEYFELDKLDDLLDRASEVLRNG